jgi:hypothetical protein
VTLTVTNLGAVEWQVRTTIETPLPVRVMSWLEQRYAETGNGTYALAAIERAIRAHGRIDEPWLVAYLNDVAGAVMSGQLAKTHRAPSETLGDALARRMRLNKGRGKDAIEEAILDIRDHDIYCTVEALLAAGGVKKNAIPSVAYEYGLDETTVAHIYLSIAKMRAAPTK